MVKVDACFKKTSFFLSFFLFVVFALCSYGFGFFNSSTQIESSLLNLHNVSISDTQYNFVHSEFYKTDSSNFLSGKTVSRYIRLTNSVDSQQKILKPYCFLSDKGKKNEYLIKCNGITVSENCSISGIHLFSDTKTMQNIPLPLYRTKEPIYKINNARNGADAGCYIPFSLAQKILDSLPIIENYNKLIDSALLIELSDDCGLSKKTFSINNIYFDSYDNELWDEHDKNKYHEDFGDYNFFFSVFNKTTFFVPIVDVFPNEEVCFCCDLKDGYGSFLTYTSVVGKSFAKDGFKLDFFLRPNETISHELNIYFNDSTFTNTIAAILFLLFAIFSFLLSIYFLIVFRKKTLLSFKKMIFVPLLFLGSIIFFWILSYLISMFGINAKKYSYLFLNRIGNEILFISFIFLVGFLIYLLIRNKQQNDVDD